jgi:formylglycine-generating enzyme required for sulfatase activity
LLAALSPGAQAEEFRDCDSCPVMVVIQPGTYLMGASKADAKFVDSYTLASERPQHEVTIGYRFAMAKFELSVAEFAAYVAETGAKTGGECMIRTPDEGPAKNKVSGTVKPTPEMQYGAVTVTDADFRTPGFEVSDKHPATCISRREAVAYLEWLAKKTGKPYRLPTEAEWEYAARAGSVTPYYYGGGPKELCKYGNFADRKSPYSAKPAAPCAEDPSPVGTAPVGSYLPNAWGLHDMAGNAFEFVEDCSFDNYEGAPADGSPWRKPDCEGFVQRSYNYDSVAGDLRSAARCLPGDWDSRASNLTLRAAISLDESAWDRK